MVPGPIFHRPTRRRLEVLKPVSGVAKAGTLTALLGESGAGKTCLLDMLARRKTFGQLGGAVYVNGKTPGKVKICLIICGFPLPFFFVIFF